MIKLNKVAMVIGSFVAVLALAGTAGTDGGSNFTVGPVPVPGVPVQVCLNQSDVPGGVNNCVSTPAAQSVSLTANVQLATPSPVFVLPPSRLFLVRAAPRALPSKSFRDRLGLRSPVRSLLCSTTEHR